MSKLTKKDLKSPDPVWQASYSAFSWLTSQWMLIAIVLGCSVLLLIGGAVYIHQAQRGEAEAQHVYSKLISDFQQWKLSEALNKKTQFDKVQESLKTLKEKHKHSRAYLLSGLVEAQLLMDEKKYAEAVESIERYEKALPSTRRSLAWYPAAIVSEEKGDFEKALVYYQKILNSKDTTYRKWALLGEGRAYRNLNKKEEAIKSYEKFLQEYPKAQELSMVRGLLRLTQSGLIR